MSRAAEFGGVWALWRGVTLILAVLALGGVPGGGALAQGNSPTVTVAITAPASGTVVTAPGTIALEAAASVNRQNWAIVRVEFYHGAQLIGTASTAPYRATWAGVPAGSYSVSAKAIATNPGQGKQDAATHPNMPTWEGVSAPVNVIVNAPPTVTLTAPSPGTVVNAPANIIVSASAADTDGTIAKVEFYQGATLIGTATNAPYSINWINVAAGSYSLTARATDDRGAVATSAAVPVIVNAAPTVSLTSPANNTVFNAPASITVTASAADSDGTVAKVDFYQGATLIGTATSAPFAVEWTNVAAGSYTLTAKATDDRGAVTTSAPVAVTVNAAPTVSITAPANNATFVAPPSITVTASAADSDGTVTQVEFFANGTPIGTATSAPYTVEWTNVVPGSYTLTARATDDRGASTTSAAVAITVNANVAPTVSITSPANNASFTAPADITLTASAADSDGSIAKVEFFHGTTPITTLTTAPYSVVWTGVPQGSYVLTARATDNLGATTTSAPVSVTVNAAVASTLYFIHTDHLNTPRLIANQTQQVVWRWDNLDPFGGNPPDENPSGLGNFTCNLRLPGQYFDRETNTHYNYFRDYDPGIGRYVQSDPISLRGGINTFSYVHNNPIGFSDASGLAVWLCVRSVSFRVGNHSYFYDDKSRQCCGYPGWNFDKPLENCPDRGRGPGVDSCTLISYSDDDAKKLFSCCKRGANPFTYFPTVNDCQNLTDDCIRSIGMAPPYTPRAGRWMGCNTCWRRQ